LYTKKPEKSRIQTGGVHFNLGAKKESILLLKLKYTRPDIGHIVGSNVTYAFL
jgi:hypothetical protein